MKKTFKNRIVVFCLVAGCVLSLGINVYFISRANQFEAQKALWSKQRYLITKELNQINEGLRAFHNMVKEFGLEPNYEKMLEVEYGDEAKKISNEQIKFNFFYLNLVDEDSFVGYIKNILKGLKTRLSSQYRDLLAINEKTKSVKNRITSKIPSIWPTEGTLTSLFGMRMHPIKKKRKFHTGVDIANFKSTEILSTADGIVIFADKKGGYGETVIIDHENGFKTLYGHADYLLVHKGDRVKSGTVIAGMGSTGTSTGSHLHYEIRFAGEPINPVMFVQ